MTDTSGSPSRRQWISRLTVATLVLTCALLVYLTVLVSQLSATLDKTSADLAQVLATSANVARHVDGLEGEFREIRKALMSDNARNFLTDAADLVKSIDDEAPATDARAAREIEALLRAVMTSGARFRAGGNEHTAVRMYGQLFAKYRVYRKLVGTPEQFIERVATRAIGGSAYEIITADGARPLADWLREKLAAMRKSTR
jgi:plasmid stability protein